MIELGPDEVGGETARRRRGGRAGTTRRPPTPARPPGARCPARRGARRARGTRRSISRRARTGRRAASPSTRRVTSRSSGPAPARPTRSCGRTRYSTAASDAVDATFVASPAWYLDHRLVTVHPLGGCVMGDDRSTGSSTTGAAVYPGSRGYGRPRRLVRGRRIDRVRSACVQPIAHDRRARRAHVRAPRPITGCRTTTTHCHRARAAPPANRRSPLSSSPNA